MKIKICGLTQIEEAEYLNTLPVDFAGMVLFFPKSKRNIQPEQAKEIINALSSNIKKVAVMVSPSLEQIKQVADCGFDFVQIHGKLSQDILEESPIPIWKAFNVSDMETYSIWKECEKIEAFVFDAAQPGSGKAFDWNMLQEIPRDAGKLFILAGGLSPENVAKAIAYVGPDGVDVSSGVEYMDKPGKDLEKVKAFVDQVRNI